MRTLPRGLPILTVQPKPTLYPILYRFVGEDDVERVREPSCFS